MNDKPRFRFRQLLAGLSETLAFMSMLSLSLIQFQQKAYLQSLDPVASDEAVAIEVEPTPVRAPCPVPNPPAPGDKVELCGDEEILLSRQANDQKALANSIINNRVGTTQLDVSWSEAWWTSGRYSLGSQHVRWHERRRHSEDISAFKYRSSYSGALSWPSAVLDSTDWYGTHGSHCRHAGVLSCVAC